MVEKSLPGTSLAITARAGVTLSTVTRWLKILRAEGKCHIGGWKRGLGKQGAFKPVYVRGPGEPVPCPFKRLEQKEYGARHRARIKKDGREFSRAAKQSARWYANKAASGKMTDPLSMAFFGRKPNIQPQQETA